MILFIGHAGMPTGFARVLDSIASHLSFPVSRLPVDASPADIAAVGPDVVLVLDEPWVCARLAPLLCGSYPTIFYPAVDGERSVTPGIAAELARADVCVAFQQFGRDILERHFAALAAWPSRLESIPHGVDAATFHPVGDSPDRDAARREVFGTSDLAGAFVVLNANRNQPFKRIDLTIEGFASFALDKPASVKLCLHMGTRPPAPGEVMLADRFGVRDRLLFTGKGERHPFAPDHRLNLIYNACDVGVNTSEKEGWGLIAFEHGATRAAQIVPRHTACADWEGAALLLDPGENGRSVTAEGVAAALERLYGDDGERARLAGAAFARATEPRFGWKNIARQWDALFAGLTGTSLPPASSG